jgi:hypothetical protein
MNENFKGLYQGLQGLGRNDKKGGQGEEEEVDFQKLVKADKDIPTALKVRVEHYAQPTHYAQPHYAPPHYACYPHWHV